jgi:eukaryotic-like serine/threonine-protein kinase
VKVLDFGVAKLLKQIGDLPKSGTAQGIVVGTPEYMAPEQALGLPIDARADIYSVGLVLYEMLTGVQPFQAETFGKLVVQITTRSLPALPMRTRAGEMIPRSLSEVVLKCLAKKPEERFTTTEELAQALEQFTGRSPPPDVAPVESDAKAIEAMKPKTGRMLLVGAAVLALIGGGGYLAFRPSPEAAVPPPPPVETPKEPEQIVLEIQSNPTGARVSNAETGEAVGVTPLEVKLDKSEGMLTLRFELEGRQTLQRAVSLARNNALSVDLAPAQGEKAEPAAKQKKKPR